MQIESIAAPELSNLISRLLPGEGLLRTVPAQITFRPAGKTTKLPAYLAGLAHGAVRPASIPRTLIRTNYLPLKRWIDLSGALLLLAALTPLLLVVALLVRRTAGPVLIRQTRLTRGGRTFQMLKLRTMFADAESRTGAVWTQRNDPRITPIGRLLRRTRIDELPQLINVLRGDMSLIGPRPERPEFSQDLAKRYPSFIRRLEVNAGISGLAQVYSGYCGDIESYRTKVKFDRVYVRHCSFWLDLKIGMQTIGVLLTGAGAR